MSHTVRDVQYVTHQRKTPTAKKKTTTPAFFLVEKCAEFLFWSKVKAAYGLETVITVITVISPPPV
jgi:hypothetical protein